MSTLAPFYRSGSDWRYATGTDSSQSREVTTRSSQEGIEPRRKVMNLPNHETAAPSGRSSLGMSQSLWSLPSNCREVAREREGVPRCGAAKERACEFEKSRDSRDWVKKKESLAQERLRNAHRGTVARIGVSLGRAGEK
jgi:hypothetical protein